MKKRGLAVGMLLVLFGSVHAFAETDPYFELSLLTGSVDGSVARREGIGARGWGGLVGGGLRFNRFLSAGAELTAQYVSDEDSFTQLTTLGRYRSTTTLLDVAPYAALRLPLGESLRFGANGGYSLVFGTRTIENCSNCFSEDLDVDGGLYVEPIVAFGREDRLQVGASLRLYLDGDVKNMFMVRVAKTF